MIDVTQTDSRTFVVHIGDPEWDAILNRAMRYKYLIGERLRTLVENEAVDNADERVREELSNPGTGVIDAGCIGVSIAFPTIGPLSKLSPDDREALIGNVWSYTLSLCVELLAHELGKEVVHVVEGSK